MRNVQVGMRYASLSGDTGLRENAPNWELAGAPRYTAPLIDLHARRCEERRRTFSKIRRDLALAGMLLLCMALTLTPLLLWLRGLQEHLHRAQTDSTQWRQRAQILSQDGTALDRRLDDWTRYCNSRDRRLALNNLCALIAARLPASVYLEQTQIDAGSEPERLVLIGCAESMPALLRYAGSLSTVSFFTNVRLVETMPFAALGPQGIHFRIEAQGNGALNLPKE